MFKIPDICIIVYIIITRSTLKTNTCEVPVIMFLMKSRWPGASIMVKVYLWVLNFSKEMSIVIPRSLSAFNLSRTQAYLKELFPIFKRKENQSKQQT